MIRPNGLPVLLTIAMAIPGLLAAQVRGIPVMQSGGALRPTVDVAVATANDAAGGTTSLGASIGSGLGPVSITGLLSRGAPVDGDDAVWSEGVAVTGRIFGGPLVPFRVMVQGGAGFWSGGVVDHLHIPISLGLAATIPYPAFAIRPWLAPRISIRRTSFQGVGSTDTNFGISGGIDLGFLNGLVIRAAYDRESFDGSGAAGILSFGLGYALGR